MKIRKVRKDCSPDGDRECSAQTFFTKDDATVEYYPSAAPFDALACQHEVAHALRHQGNEMHHPRWHFCILVPTNPWRWGLTWACKGTTLQEQSVGRALFAVDDLVDLDVPA